MRADDAGKHRRILYFYGLGPVGSTAAETHLTRVEHQHMFHLMARGNRGLRPCRARADNGDIVNRFFHFVGCPPASARLETAPTGCR